MQKSGQSLNLPLSSYNKMKCKTCKGYLSIPPVDLAQEVCGRCNTNKVSSVAYEEIAQYVLFPCIYPKCEEKIAWGEAEAHEMECIYKTFLCPVEECFVEYNIVDTPHHFQEFHKQLKHNGLHPLTIVPTHNNSSYIKQVYQIDYESESFLVFAYGIFTNYPRFTRSSKMKFYQNQIQYYFGVFATNPNYQNNMKFEIAVNMKSDGNKSVSYSQKDQKVILLDERAHCFKCIGGSYYTQYCATYHHKVGVNFLSVTFDRVDICEGATYTIHMKPNDQMETPANKDIAKKLECPICFQYMSAPIYICETGHTICKNCKQSLANCPYCKVHLGDQRNFTLEHLAEAIKELCDI